MSHETGSPLPANAVTVESSALAQLAYDQPRAILHVVFPDGAIHRYSGVPLHTYRELLRAESKGAYFNRHIRNAFPAQCTARSR
jgi:hypothetical protein